MRPVAWSTVVSVVMVTVAGILPAGSDRADTLGPEPMSSSFLFAAAGDHTQNANTQASLNALAASGAAFYLALGDLSYGSGSGEQAWCDMVTATMGTAYPFELVSGNHEDDSMNNGWIGDFVNCLPDHLGARGTYGAQYYIDYPAGAPLMRAVMISPDLTVFGVTYDYVVGNTHYNWLSTAIDEARASGIPWVVVGMHKNCITTGSKSCEIGADLFNLLMAKRVDLIFQGHDHNVQRSKQLACPSIKVGGYDPSCVVDDGSDDLYGKGLGPVLVISGTFGRCCYGVSWGDSESGYFVNIDDATNGFWTYAVNASAIVATFVPTNSGSFRDSFEISGAVPPPPTDVQAELVNGDQDVRIFWTPSSPETAVDHYEVWRSGQYDEARIGYAKASPNLTPGTAEWTDTSQMMDAFYFVRAVAPSLAFVSSAGQVAKLTRILPSAQAYLLSVPLVTESAFIADQFRGTVGWTLARSFVASDLADPWKAYNRSRSFNELTTVSVQMGVWVHVTAPGEYRVAGAVPCSVSIDLMEGWNLVGFPSMTPRIAATATQGLLGPLAVEGYAENVPPYHLFRLSPSDLMLPLQAYWVYSPVEQIWTVMNDADPSCVPSVPG